MARKVDRRQYLKGYRAAKAGKPIPVTADAEFRKGHEAYQNAHGGLGAPRKVKSMDETKPNAHEGAHAAVEAAGLPTPETAPQPVRAEVDPALHAVDPDDAGVDETEADRDERGAGAPGYSASGPMPGTHAATPYGVCWAHAHPDLHCQTPKPDGTPCGVDVHEAMPPDQALQLAAEIPTVITMMLRLPRPVVLAPEQIAGLGYSFTYTSARWGVPGPGIAALAILGAVAKSIFDQVREIKASARAAGDAPPPADPTPTPTPTPPQTPPAANGEQRTIVKRAA